MTKYQMYPNKMLPYAGIAQLVEYKLPKLGVASSNLVARSNSSPPFLRRRLSEGRTRIKWFIVLLKVNIMNR